MIKFIASAAVMAVLLVGPRAATADGTITYDSITSNTGSFFKTGFNMADDVHLDAVKSITGFDIRFSSAAGGSLHVRVWENDPSNSSVPFLDGRLGSPALLAEATVTGLGGNSIAHIDLPAPIEAADIWVGLESAELAYVGLDVGSTFSGGSSIDEVLNLHFSGAFTKFGSFGSGNLGLCCNAAGETFLGSLAMRVYGVDIAPAVTLVDIDIKPGSDPNSINMCGSGVIPVLIFGSADFMVSDIDISTLRLGDGTPESGSAVKMAGRSGKDLCSTEDVDLDGYDDLVCQFVTVDIDLAEGAEDATVLGTTTGEQEFAGTDTVNIVKFCE